MVRCPSCDGEFDVENMRGTTVAVCKACDGVWLTAGDLDHVTGIELEAKLGEWVGEPTECRYCRAPLGFGVECLRCKRHPTIQCPRGHGVMQTAIVEIGDREFEIDRCASCRGIWIDGHEQQNLHAAPESTRTVHRPVPSLAGRSYSSARTVDVLTQMQNRRNRELMGLLAFDLGWYPGQRPEPVAIGILAVVTILGLLAAYWFLAPVLSSM